MWKLICLTQISSWTILIAWCFCKVHMLKQHMCPLVQKTFCSRNKRTLVIACVTKFMQKKLTEEHFTFASLWHIYSARKLTSLSSSYAARTLTEPTFSCATNFAQTSSSSTWIKVQTQEINVLPNGTFAAPSKRSVAIALTRKCMPKAMRLEEKERPLSNRYFSKQRARQRSPKTTCSAQNY